jgi:hypothetical protein
MLMLLIYSSPAKGRSAAADRGPENVFVGPIVIPELEFRNVKREIFPADFVIVADDPALHQRPEAFDGIGVDRTDDVLPLSVLHGPVPTL